MTLLSRVLGLVRDVVLARLFGAGLDSFVVAFSLPYFLRRFFAEGAFSQAFVPVLAEYKERRRAHEVRVLLTQVALLLAAVLLLIALLGILAAPLLVTLLAPGFHGETRHLQAVDMLRLPFPYLPLISLTPMAAAILPPWGRLAVPAFTPVLLNLSLIGCALLLAPRLADPLYALAWGVLLGGVVQLLFQGPFLARLGLLSPARGRHDSEGPRRIVTLMLPALFAVSVVQLNTLVDTLLASLLQQGSISWLYYADRLMEFPLGVFGIALGTVLLPALSSAHARGDGDGAAAMLDWALRLVLCIGLPAALGLIMLCEVAMITLFQYDRFTLGDARAAAAALAAYAVGVPALILVKVLSSAYFARQDMVTPVRIGVIAVIVNLLMNLLLMRPLGHVGLATATSVAAGVQALLLYHGLRRRGAYVPGARWGVLLLRVAAACLLMTLLLRWWLPGATAWLAWDVWQRVGGLLLAVLGGMAVYAFTLLAAGLRPRHLLRPAVYAGAPAPDPLPSRDTDGPPEREG